MSLYGSFEIGKKSLTASQMGQSTTGHNIANVDTEGFSRQEVSQATSRPTAEGKGTGVDVTGVRRMQDGFTKQKIIDEQNRVGTWQTKEKVLTEAEVIYTDLDGSQLRGAMDEFWNAWGAIANEPESVPLRKTLISKSGSLAQSFQLFDKRLRDFRSNLNDRIVGEVEEINQLASEIALLNKQVQQLESRGMPANDGRDKREAALQKLSEKMEIKWFENHLGIMEVQIANGQTLVHGRDTYNLTPVKSAEALGDIRLSLVNPPGLDTDVTGVIRGGALKEYINQRDGNIREFHANLNEMVNEIAFKINQIHSTGTGINGIKTSETGFATFDQELQQMPVADLKSGNFEIKMIDEFDNIEETLTIEIEAGVDSSQAIVDKINRAAGAYDTTPEGVEILKDKNKMLATVNDNGSISLESGLGKRFIFGKDNTNTFTKFGLNCFFHLNYGARDIQINPELLEDEMKIAAGSDLVPGDNEIALGIAGLQLATTMNDETITFNEFYNKQITDVGLKVQDARKGLNSHNQMLDQYVAIRDSISGVNLDEEMTNMVKYQRAYESSAKFLSTINEMTQTVINM